MHVIDPAGSAAAVLPLLLDTVCMMQTAARSKLQAMCPILRCQSTGMQVSLQLGTVFLLVECMHAVAMAAQRLCWNLSSIE
jgi:hypothetical protein